MLDLLGYTVQLSEHEVALDSVFSQPQGAKVGIVRYRYIASMLPMTTMPNTQDIRDSLQIQGQRLQPTPTQFLSVLQQTVDRLWTVRRTKVMTRQPPLVAALHLESRISKGRARHCSYTTTDVRSSHFGISYHLFPSVLSSTTTLSSLNATS